MKVIIFNLIETIVFVNCKNIPLFYSINDNSVESFEVKKTVVYDYLEKKENINYSSTFNNNDNVLINPETNPILDITYNELEKKFIISGINFLRSYELSGCQYST